MTRSSAKLAENHLKASHSLGMDRLKETINGLLPTFIRDFKLGRYYLKNGEVELQLVPLLCSRDRDSMDIGANEGMYLHFMRKHSRHTLAFEPIEDLVAKLGARYPSNVTVLRLALSDRTGSATLHIPVAGKASVTGLSSLADVTAEMYPDHRDVAISTARLDDIYSGVVGFIKIDVEGHELAVLEGAWNTISACRPNILIETEEHLTPGGLQTIIAKLHTLDYEGHFVQRGTWRPIGEFDVAR